MSEMSESLSFEEYEFLEFMAHLFKSRPAFYQKAACKNEKMDDFFPKQGQSSVMKKAISICKTCPVQYECLKYSLEGEIEHGVWGGTSADDRRDWIRRGLTIETVWDSVVSE